MSTLITAGVGLATALIGAFVSWRLFRTTLRGRARLIHEDLWRMQSTVARLYYQRTEQFMWGANAAWLLTALADPEAQQDVLAHLSHRRLSPSWEFPACASAIGWAEYLRGAWGYGRPPCDCELEEIYERLAEGRIAVASLAHIGYRQHRGKKLIGAATRNQARKLPKLTHDEVLAKAKTRCKAEGEGSRLFGVTVPTRLVKALPGRFRRSGELPSSPAPRSA
jgi:hypothetical protein